MVPWVLREHEGKTDLLVEREQRETVELKDCVVRMAQTVLQEKLAQQALLEQPEVSDQRESQDLQEYLEKQELVEALGWQELAVDQESTDFLDDQVELDQVVPKETWASVETREKLVQVE